MLASLKHKYSILFGTKSQNIGLDVGPKCFGTADDKAGGGCSLEGGGKATVSVEERFATTSTQAHTYIYVYICAYKLYTYSPPQPGDRAGPC